MGTKAFWKVAIFTVLIFCLLQATARADDIKTGQRPGNNDPLSRTILFQDDELLVLTGYTNTDTYSNAISYSYFFPTDDDLTNPQSPDWHIARDIHQFSSSEYGSSSKFRHMAAASGRVVHPDRDTAVYAFFRPDGDVKVELWDPQSGRQTNNLLLRGPIPPVFERSLDVAVGDLDKSVDDNGMYHDEIVVVWPYDSRSGVSGCAIGVLDKDLNAIGGDIFSYPPGNVPSLVAVTIGDFDGDGYLEVAVGMAYHTNEGGILVRLYRFARNQDGSSVTPLQFQKVSDYSAPGSAVYKRAFDMTAGDFDGDGKDEIYFVTAVADHDPAQNGTSLVHTILRADKDFNLSQVFSQTDKYGYIALGQLRTQSGLFKFDLPNGWGLNRREVVTCFVVGDNQSNQGHGPNNQVRCEFYSFSANSSGGFDRVSITPYSVGPWVPASFYSDIDLAVGNYIGRGVYGTQTSPLMYPLVAFTYCLVSDDYSAKLTGAMVFGLPGQTNFVRRIFNVGSYDFGTGETEPIMPVAATALDGDGDTWRLGPPMHLTIENLISLDYIIQEPPKHVDYLPLKPEDPNSAWDVINVSAKSSFNVEFGKTQLTTVTSTSTDTSSHSLGASAEIDVKKTFSAGSPVISKYFETTVDVDTKLSYDYESSKSEWNSSYQKRTISFTSRTEKDDLVAGKLQLFDIWRYPVIGYYTMDIYTPYKMYEVILPGPYLSFPQSSGGLDHADWYQPTHQNRNILSYPRIGTAFFPPDVGEYQLPDGTTKNEIMNEPDVLGVNWDESYDVYWREESISYNKTLSESLDIKVGKSGKAEIGHSKTIWQGSLNFNKLNSWGGSKTSNVTNSASKGVTLNLPSGDSTKAYAFEPAFYVSSGGGMFKGAHAVDPLWSSTGRDWWIKQYGNKPDPALNLPNRFIWNAPKGNELEEYWTLNKDDTRMEMRGFFMRHNTPDPVSGQYELIDPGSLTDGDAVQLCARVYNFSLSIPTGPFDVLFEYVPIDGSLNEMGPRVKVETFSITNLGAFETGDSMREVCVPWNTTGLGDSKYIYRFYVTVDPDDVVKNEIHEWKDSQGNKLIHGNNEGYWPWGSGIAIAPQASQAPQAEKPGVSMHGESLAIEKDSGLKSKGPVRVLAGETYRLRAHIVADGHHRGQRYTVFFDGPPEEGKVIAVKASFGLIDGDNYVWANWTPQETGEREIYVHFIEDSDEETKGDAWDSLKVVVRREPISWRDEIIDRLRGVEE